MSPKSTLTSVQQVPGDPVAPTSVVQCAVKVEAASVVSRHQLHQVSKPGVPRPGEAGQSHQVAGALWQEGSFFAPRVWRGTKHGRSANALSERVSAEPPNRLFQLAMMMTT